MGDSGLRVERKIVVVGDGACGKTCMLRTFHDGRFPEDLKYIPTVFEVCVKTIDYAGGTVELGLWDTAGQEDYDRLRIMAYPDADVVLVCFSVDVIDSLSNVFEKWLPEVREMASRAKVMLVALKIDLRTDPVAVEHIERMYQRGPLAFEEGKHMARAMGIPYIECSAKRNQHVNDVFAQAVAMVVDESEFAPEPEEKCCIIL
ncbi:GTP-binding protein Rho1 [Coemansia sp. RSA 2706]|nr:GTP-binding protein Rho1 [Coemansia sp. RSA 2706]KAJ2304357.1 GTP-binding protein Rho1 [Coemansia sp. RSA 2705]KAJ2310399.1 GTP-binding protein Rho1 [Coemansia sp. RSA 2704]KAJ2319077.1 GTP-binding protein Rho1 [Coemansia sp. RSA 2702]KAJ2360996.1 GTP-binding protein Rho1 [Coemansia sp. RSA 2610]KAJ2383941.1 GTP-binding protein Rho1 [Coemansia sp. RSA 2611]KAJ2721671.1 GTP-binding protein Rho1 [Coemansia sp. Cherry 401B]